MTGTDHFLAYLRTEKRYSENTLISYQKDLEQYHAFCHENGKEGMDLFFKTIRNWVVSMMEQGHAPRTIHRKLSSLRSYCKFLIRIGDIESDPVEKVLKPKMNKRLPQFVDVNGMNDLLDQYDFGDDYFGVRNRLVINLLYQTGIRRSELIGLKCFSVDTGQGMVKVVGKRNKERIIPLGRELSLEIERYLVQRNKAFPGAGDALFLSAKGLPAYPQLVYRIVSKYIGLVTTLDKTSPHILRHTFATHMLNNGADINAIKELLGHASLSATQVYTHNSFEKLKSIYNQAHPRA
ncbi:MAG: tyrosine-type recombinase/integrase [Bacteroidales bacterium]|nr:tyrosine-type recombinase/integrase [Bacteroidales bacterium]